MCQTIMAVTLVLCLSIPAWALECRFTRETTPPLIDPERTTFVLNCELPLPAEAVWKALRDFPRWAEKGGRRPKEVEYARYLDSEAAKREVAARLENLPLSRKPDTTSLLNLPLDSSLLYEEHYHIDLFFLWGVRRFAADTSRSEEDIYRLAFDKVNGLSSEAVFQGSFELTGKGERSHLRYTLILSTHQKLTGEGLLDIFQRLIVGDAYLDGYQTYMEERVEGIVREAQDLDHIDASRDG